MILEYIFRHYFGRNNERVTEIPESDVDIFTIPVEAFMF